VTHEIGQLLLSAMFAIFFRFRIGYGVQRLFQRLIEHNKKTCAVSRFFSSNQSAAQKHTHFQLTFVMIQENNETMMMIGIDRRFSVQIPSSHLKR
jgi:hypothetical protein